MKNWGWLVLLFCSVTFGFDHQYAQWEKWLNDFTVTEGTHQKVDYKKAKAQPAPLTSFIHQIEAINKTDFSRMSDNQKLAFLINFYNAQMIRLTVIHYPMKSVKELGTAFIPYRENKFFKFLGEEQNLNFIFHDSLRKKFSDPRIHFALTYSSLGGPGIFAEPFTSDKLEQQLEKAAIAYVNDSTKNRFDTLNNKLYLSNLFNWYGSDFMKAGGGTIGGYVAKYLTPDAKYQEQLKSAPVEYLEWDYSLNEGTVAPAQ